MAEQGNKSQTVVLKADAEMRTKLIDFYQDRMCEKTPPYAVFQAKEEDCTITLYESGKLMFQGKVAESEASIWSSLGAGEVPAKATKNEKKNVAAGGDVSKFEDDTAIGSDEVGTGDFFGPIVVTASYVREEDFSFLRDLGVQDSKKITDEKILSIAPTIMQKIRHVTLVQDNPTYNQMWAQNYNMNRQKAIFHNRCLAELQKYTGCKLLVVDQFEPPSAYYKHLQGEAEVVQGITFMTKAEDKCLAVATSSIISRYCFLQKMKELGAQYGLEDGLPLGAGAGVDAIGVSLVQNYGPDVLGKIAKTNFANMQKVLDAC